MAEWQPMATAKQDGTEYILLIQGVAIEGYFNRDRWECITLLSHGCGCCSYTNDQPTHWMDKPNVQ